jgi:hypothetical protein
LKVWRSSNTEILHCIKGGQRDPNGRANERDFKNQVDVGRPAIQNTFSATNQNGRDIALAGRVMASPVAVVTHGDGAFSSSYRESRQVGGTMRVLIGASIIVVGAFALAAIKEFVDSLPLAVALEILLLAVAVGIFVWLR